ncbi:hypothetical protein J2Y73_005129 [Peribacillus frigoritolerans]|uniref:HNH endonuclease n=1 Tax=Peribacillus frigoritolerans TaxID=450367 RepID=UPI00209F743C|nr:HNH endonuclease domain-containing protein [Peribacillus frigoritolerans]MCP1495098.1 hypothetical protein [Peribacillus frigoritolerans]
MRRVVVDPELDKIVKAFDLFVSDFFQWVLSHDPNDPDLEGKINIENSPLAKVARKTSVKKLLISFVQCPDRNFIQSLYMYYIKNYQNIVDGTPYLISKFTPETWTLVINSFDYFYDTLLNIKIFQRNYIPDYDGPKELKREIRKKFGEEKVCPYCDFHNISHEDFSSIDHFLPKSRFPLLSIYSENLVIACAGCNDRIKRDAFELPIFHPLFDDVTNYITFKFDQTCSRINIDYNVTFIHELKSATNYCELFKLEEVYITILYKLRSDRKKIRKSVETKFLLIDISKRDFTLLKKLYRDEVDTFLNENIERRGSFGLTKLRIDFCKFLIEEGQKFDLDYLAEKLTIEIQEDVSLSRI